jgi:hypothetical protein
MLSDHFEVEMADGTIFTFKDPEDWPEKLRDQDLPVRERIKALIGDDTFEAFIAYPEVTTQLMGTILTKYGWWVKRRALRRDRRRSAKKSHRDPSPS